MAGLVVLAAALSTAATMLLAGAAWYEAAGPGLIAGLIFILQAHWSLQKVSLDPLQALRVMMTNIAIHFTVMVGGGLALVLVAGFDPIAVFVALLAAFAVCQPMSAVAIRRRILAAPDSSGRGGASSGNSTRTPFAEASA